MWCLNNISLVATVPTVYGIETQCLVWTNLDTAPLQQYLPFTVLKRKVVPKCKYWLGCNSTYRLRYWNFWIRVWPLHIHSLVATVPTVYGIETNLKKSSLWNYISELQQYLPFTVLKHKRDWKRLDLTASCNSTYRLRYWNTKDQVDVYRDETTVATVPTVYGIETCLTTRIHVEHYSLLQQYLPFTVLKLHCD